MSIEQQGTLDFEGERPVVAGDGRGSFQSPPNLVAAPHLHGVFREIYYHLYTNSNLPRAERLAAETIRLLFCKIYDERYNDMPQFHALPSEKPEVVLARIRQLFEAVKQRYPGVFDPHEDLRLNAKAVKYVVSQLQPYSLLETDKDAVGEAFEAFLGPSLRGEKGQFFTPRSVVRMIVDLLDPQLDERIIDPACGSGGFLIATLGHIWRKIGGLPPNDGITAAPLTGRNIFGIDREVDLVKITQAYMAIMGSDPTGIFCGDSLDPATWTPQCHESVCEGSFEVVMTNPPFGTKIPVKDRKILACFDLGHRWTYEGATERWVRTQTVLDAQDPQVLFIEMCVRLLAEGGRMGMVLPEGLFGNRSSGYVLDYLRARGAITSIVDCPRTLFQPSTDTKCNVLLFRKLNDGEGHRPHSLFLSIVRKCGHNRRGQPLTKPDGSLDDEFPLVAQNFSAPVRNQTRLGFWRTPDQLQPYYLIPRYYDPEIAQQLREFQQSGKYALKTIGELIDEGGLSIAKGHEIGSEAYGTGDVPFIRTSDIANWEITHDPTKSVSEEVYREYSQKQRLQAGDILFVNDGRYRIGNVCILTDYDTRIVIQSHFRVLRVLKEAVLSPYLLLYLLKTPFVRWQIQSKTFIQSTIATIGPRLRELVLPIPRDAEVRREIETKIERIVKGRAELLKEGQELDNLFADEEASPL